MRGKTARCLRRGLSSPFDPQIHRRRLVENNGRSPNRRVCAPAPPTTVLPVSGTEKRQRPKVIQIRVSAEEFTLIGDSADRAGLTVASYARQALLLASPARSVRRPPIDRTAIAQALAALGRIGSDVRELAQSMRTSGTEPAVGIELAETIERLNDARDALMRALRRDP